MLIVEVSEIQICHNWILTYTDIYSNVKIQEDGEQFYWTVVYVCAVLKILFSRISGSFYDPPVEV